MGFMDFLKAGASLIPGVGPIISAGVGAAQAGLQYKGGKKANLEQQRAVDLASGQISGGVSRAQNIARQYQAETNDSNSPFLQAGQEAIGQAAGLVAPGGELDSYKPEQYTAGQYQGGLDTFQFDPSKIQMDPAFARRAERGSQAILAAKAAMGGLTSGATGKRLIDYNQELTSDEYAKAYGREYQQQGDTFASKAQRELNQQDIFGKNEAARAGAFKTNLAATTEAQQDRWNRLMGLTQAGQTASAENAAANRFYGGQSVNAEIQGSQNLADLAVNKGDVRAAGLVNRTNALNAGIDAVKPAAQLTLDAIRKKYGVRSTNSPTGLG